MLDVSLVTLGSPDQLTGGYLYHRRMADLAADHEARVRFVSFPPLPFPLALARGGTVVEETAGSDVVVVDSIVAWALAAALPGRRQPSGRLVPVVGSLHQPPGGIDHGRVRTWLQGGLDRRACRSMDLLVVASQALGEQLLTLRLDAPLEVVPPGRDVAPPPTGPLPDLRRGRRCAFLAVGNWVARKGIVELLDALAALPPDAATLHLVGRTDVEAAYARRVQTRLQDSALAGRVVVHGPVPKERVAELYAAADVFVLPSRAEPYGTVYGEAMAAGLPVVGWRAGNLPHLAEDGREGVAVTPGDVAGLAAALTRLAHDEPWRRALAEAARRRAQTFPTWAESAERFFAVLRSAAR